MTHPGSVWEGEGGRESCSARVRRTDWQLGGGGGGRPKRSLQLHLITINVPCCLPLLARRSTIRSHHRCDDGGLPRWGTHHLEAADHPDEYLMQLAVVVTIRYRPPGGPPWEYVGRRVDRESRMGRISCALGPARPGPGRQGAAPVGRLSRAPAALALGLDRGNGDDRADKPRESGLWGHRDLTGQQRQIGMEGTAIAEYILLLHACHRCATATAVYVHATVRVMDAWMHECMDAPCFFSFFLSFFPYIARNPDSVCPWPAWRKEKKKEKRSTGVHKSPDAYGPLPLVNKLARRHASKRRECCLASGACSCHPGSPNCLGAALLGSIRRGGGVCYPLAELGPRQDAWQD